MAMTAKGDLKFYWGLYLILTAINLNETNYYYYYYY